MVVVKRPITCWRKRCRVMAPATEAKLRHERLRSYSAHKVDGESLHVDCFFYILRQIKITYKVTYLHAVKSLS